MASGSHALNCYFDKDLDVNMGRTSRRPIPSGRIPAWHAAVLGAALGVVAFIQLWLTVNPAAALLSFAGLLYYVFIYTLWLKRSSFNNIVIGGGAGAFPPLVGWAAVTGGVTPAALVLWLIVFYWTPPHFWALALIRQKDYARAGVPMLPVVAGDEETRWQIVLYSVQLVVITLLPTPFGMLGLPYLGLALLLGAIFLYYALRLRRLGTTASAWGLYKYSLLYLALLFVAMVLDRAVF
jgi:protoheme IX farnesyltransferase